MPDNQDNASQNREPDLEKYREKVVRLLRFLEEYVRLKAATAVLDISRYEDEGIVLWFHDIPESEDIFCQASCVLVESEGDVWLRVRKQSLPPCPTLPILIEPWVEISDVLRSGGAEPQLREVAYLPIPREQVVPIEEPPDEDSVNDNAQPKLWLHKLADHPEVNQEWQRFLTKWRLWSEEHARRSVIQKIYATLYSAYQKQKRFGEAYELVVGIGLLTAQNQLGRKIRRHIITAQAQLEFDSKEGVVRLQCPPPPEGAHLKV